MILTYVLLASSTSNVFVLEFCETELKSGPKFYFISSLFFVLDYWFLLSLVLIFIVDKASSVPLFSHFYKIGLIILKLHNFGSSIKFLYLKIVKIF
jgi:hypothetical protein